MATETQVRDGGSHVTGTLKAHNIHHYVAAPFASIQSVNFTAGHISLVILDISTTGWSGPLPNPPVFDPLGFQFAIYIADTAVLPSIVDHEFVDFDPDDDDFPWEIERAFDIGITGRQIDRTESTAAGPGRENSPVFAREVTETDAWRDINPITTAVTFGSLSYNVAQTGGPPWLPAAMTAIDTIGIGCTIKASIDWNKYGSIEDLQWDGAEVNFSRYEEETNAGNNPTDGGTGLYADGLLGGIDFRGNQLTADGFVIGHGHPYIVDFSEFGVWARGGGGAASGRLEEDLRISGGFQSTNRVPSSLGWSPDP